MMSDTNPKLEKLFDQEMNATELKLLRDELGAKEFEKQVRLQNKIEYSICKNFESDAVDDQTHQEKLIALGINDVSPNRLNRSNVPGVLVLAASLLVALTIGYYWVNQSSSNSIRFKQVSFAKLYGDAVSRGFRPYYDCSEPKRFAAEFKRRQGIELRLDSLPANQTMLGVSYLGGVSRNTTAVLFEADQEPVIVFVDKVDSQPDDLLFKRMQDPAVSIHKTTRYGLVFYEVSKSNQPLMTKYFQLVD